MSDFYSVLKGSIVDRGLRSPAAREEVYAQARAAMIRQLWSYDPPLAEDEIDTRIGSFDRTVERIEGDLVAVFADPAPRPATSTRNRKPPPAKPTTAVFEGYDDDADYATAANRPSREAPRPADAARGRMNADEEEAIEIGRFARRLAPDSLAERSAAVEEALREDTDEDEWSENEDRRPSQADESEHDYGHDDNLQDGFDENRGGDSFDDEDRHEGRDSHADRDAAYRGREDRARRLPAIPNLWARQSEQNRIRILVGAIAAFAVVLITVATLIGISVFSAPGPGQQAEVPVGPAGPATGVPEEATQIAAQAADVLQSFTVFDGRDPTVFESASDNPIRFDNDKDGNFARVTSSTTDAGTRVLLGPGLAGRLAGQMVRVVIMARSARENGAANMRFAYQSGVALSHWQSANLAPSYASYGLMWRVPAQRTDPNGDDLLIEPGIPGDGTAMEIQSVRIDLIGKQPG